jgi:hypothetical protein
MWPGRAWGARGSAGDTRLHGPPSASSVSCTHASQWTLIGRVWPRGDRAPRACSDCVSARMRKAFPDAAVEAVTATSCGATPLCSRGRTTTRILAGEGLGAVLRRFCFRWWFTRLRLRLGVRGRLRRRRPIVRPGRTACCFGCGGRRSRRPRTSHTHACAHRRALRRPPLRLHMRRVRVACCVLHSASCGLHVACCSGKVEQRHERCCSFLRFSIASPSSKPRCAPEPQRGSAVRVLLGTRALRVCNGSHTQTDTCTHTHITHTRTHTSHIHTHTHTHTHTPTHTHTHEHMHTSTHRPTHARTHWLAGCRGRLRPIRDGKSSCCTAGECSSILSTLSTPPALFVWLRFCACIGLRALALAFVCARACVCLYVYVCVFMCVCVCVCACVCVCVYACVQSVCTVLSCSCM